MPLARRPRETDSQSMGPHMRFLTGLGTMRALHGRTGRNIGNFRRATRAIPPHFRRISVSRLFNGGPKPIVSLLTYRAFCPWHQLQHDKVIYEMKLKYR